MDSLDPLNTVDSIAPHTTSFSSNIYLLKHDEKTYTKGQLVKVSEEIPANPEEVLYFTVNSEISIKEFPQNYSFTALGRLCGYKIACVNGKIALVEGENQVALGRIYSISKELLINAQKISTFNDFEVFAVVKEGGTRSAGEPIGEMWKIMQENFEDTLELAYYWFISTGDFNRTAELSPPSIEAQEIIGNLNLSTLLSENSN